MCSGQLRGLQRHERVLPLGADVLRAGDDWRTGCIDKLARRVDFELHVYQLQHCHDFELCIALRSSIPRDRPSSRWNWISPAACFPAHAAVLAVLLWRVQRLAARGSLLRVSRIRGFQLHQVWMRRRQHTDLLQLGAVVLLGEQRQRGSRPEHLFILIFLRVYIVELHRHDVERTDLRPDPLRHCSAIPTRHRRPQPPISPAMLGQVLRRVQHFLAAGAVLAPPWEHGAQLYLGLVRGERDGTVQ